MLKKIPVARVTRDMFIHEFEGSWLTHSFWRAAFAVDSDELLSQVLACGASEVWIDTSRGADLASPSVAQAPGARLEPAGPVPAATTKKAATSFEDELQAAQKLREKSRAVVTSMFHEARMGNSIDASQCMPLVNEVVDSVDRNREAFVSLSRLKLADEYTYMHSVAVCGLMVALGRQMNFTDEECREAGLAGLLHDLGKAVMPQDLINKPGKLSSAEFDIIREHPRRGHDLLLAAGFENAVTLDVVLHHHERIDGRGYPDRLPGEQMTLHARMGAVCDVYDAITSNRPYKAGWDPAESIAQMASWKGHFDAEVLRAFIRSVGIYPTGSLVRMASGKLGVVTRQNSAKLTAPCVKLFFSTQSGVPLKPEAIDLSDPHCNEKIVAREPASRWQFGYLNALWAGDSDVARALDELAASRPAR